MTEPKQEHYLLPVQKYNEHLAECRECDPRNDKFCRKGKELREDAEGLQEEVG